MAWYNRLQFWNKLNPSQPDIGGTTEPSRERVYSYTDYYENLEIVNRGVNMLVDDAAEIPVDVTKETRPGDSVVKGVKRATLLKLLNYEPNPFQDINTFRRNLLIDFILDGNAFVYFDGSGLYQLPAPNVTIHTSKTTYIEKFTYKENINYYPDEVIHIKENSFNSIYRGTSRLKPALRTMELLKSMRNFQDNFFKNGAVPGLVIKSPNTLSEKIKLRLINSWTNKYRPDAGGKRPLILDGGLELDSISNVNFKDLDFQPSIEVNEKTVLKAIGIPPILLDSGNNANIRPNTRLYYLETVLPVVQKFNIAYERFFGFKLREDLTDIPALQPELRDQSAYYSTLVNTGILTPNEPRVAMGYEKDPNPESDQLRIPANIAGSAANPSEGGKPAQPEE